MERIKTTYADLDLICKRDDIKYVINLNYNAGEN